MDTRPVGFFDSGLGGASVLRCAVRLLPKENYVYFGDNANAPYGDRSDAEITELTLRCIDTLLAHNVKAIVIACNTITATCVDQLRQELDLPVVSVEPAIKPACMTPGNGHVLMLATLATTRLQRYLDLQSRMPDPSRVINIPCPGLVERIESGIFADDAFDDLLDGYLKPYWGMEVDGIVLGCTHYPFVRGAIARYAARNFTGPCHTYDGGDATALHLGHVLTEHQIVNGSGSADITYLTSGDPARFEPIFRLLMERQS